MDVREKFPVGSEVWFKEGTPLAVHMRGVVRGHVAFEGATYPVTVGIELEDRCVEMPCSEVELVPAGELSP